MAKVNIAFIFPRFTGPYGGERLLFSLARELAKSADITIYIGGGVDLGADFDLTGVKIVSTGKMRIGGHQLKTLLDFFKMPFVALKVRRNHDFVIGMGWQTTLCLYTLIKLKRLNPSAAIYYCLEPPRFLYDLKHDGRQNKIKQLLLAPLFFSIRRLDARSVRNIPHSMAISDWSADQMKQIYNKSVPIVYPGVEMTRFTSKSKEDARNELSLNGSDEIYISVSKLHPRKQLKESVDVYLKRSGANSKYFIIGDGPDRENIEAYLNEKGDKSIVLLGKLSDAEVTDYMIAADYFIFTAINEPFGIAPLEAQVAGCTVLPKPFKRKILDWPGVAAQFMKNLERFRQESSD